MGVILVCGGRDWTDSARTKAAMDIIPLPVSAVVHGGARGADSLGGDWARKAGVFTVVIPALWDAHGKGAGPRRNQAMLDFVKVDYCVAFPGGVGTADMIRRCVKAGIPVWEPYK